MVGLFRRNDPNQRQSRPCPRMKRTPRIKTMADNLLYFLPPRPCASARDPFSVPHSRAKFRFPHFLTLRVFAASCALLSDAAFAPAASGISAICPYLGGTKSRQRPALKFTRFDFHSPLRASAPLREISIPLSTLSSVSVPSVSLTRSCPLPRPSGQSAIALSRACPGARLW